MGFFVRPHAFSRVLAGWGENAVSSDIFICKVAARLENFASAVCCAAQILAFPPEMVYNKAWKK